MTAKTKAALAWTPWVIVWILGLFSVDGRLFKTLWVCIVVVNLGAYWAASRSDPDTVAGVHKILNVLLGFLVFQTAVMIFIALHAASTK